MVMIVNRILNKFHKYLSDEISAKYITKIIVLRLKSKCIIRKN